MYGKLKQHLSTQLDEIREAGLFKGERVISTAQGAHISVAEGAPVLNMCANNYLGLAQHPDIIRAAHEGLDAWGYGLASVRFICGTQKPHKQLEDKLSKFLGMEDTILYSSCFDANGGLFETLLSKDDAVISDELNHASIISQWTATSPSSARSATSRTNTTRWSWSMIPTQWDSWARREEGRTSTMT